MCVILGISVAYTEAAQVVPRTHVVQVGSVGIAVMCKMRMLVSKFEVDHSSYLSAFVAQNYYRNQASTHLWGCCQCCSDLLDPTGPCSIGTALQIPNWNAFVNGRAHVIIRLCRKNFLLLWFKLVHSFSPIVTKFFPNNSINMHNQTHMHLPLENLSRSSLGRCFVSFSELSSCGTGKKNFVENVGVPDPYGQAYCC